MTSPKLLRHIKKQSLQFIAMVTQGVVRHFRFRWKRIEDQNEEFRSKILHFR